MNHYFKDVQTLKSVDVYRVLVLFDVRNHAVGHAIKIIMRWKNAAQGFKSRQLRLRLVLIELAMMDEEEPMMCSEKWLRTGNPFCRG